MLMSVMLDNSVTSNDTNPSWNTAMPESLWTFLREDIVSQVILCYYVNQLVQGNKR